MNDAFEVIAMMFLIREKEAQDRKDYGAAVAYANAFDLLCYAVEGRDDCLSQFDGYTEANDFLNTSVFGELWALEDMFKHPEEYPKPFTAGTYFCIAVHPGHNVPRQL